ncbi:MAG TPA: hypothetical protein VEF04_04295 [Blastocatellia bacterium]|nr:hypothetical protein [Blastocatellia bacterium]
MKLLLVVLLFALAVVAPISSKASLSCKAEVICLPDAGWSKREKRCEQMTEEDPGRKNKSKDKKTARPNDKKDSQ